jgi:hypothetical protein
LCGRSAVFWVDAITILPTDPLPGRVDEQRRKFTHGGRSEPEVSLWEVPSRLVNDRRHKQRSSHRPSGFWLSMIAPPSSQTVSWPKIPISLKIPRKGEWKAQACEKLVSTVDFAMPPAQHPHAMIAATGKLTRLRAGGLAPKRTRPATPPPARLQPFAVVRHLFA